MALLRDCGEDCAAASNVNLDALICKELERSTCSCHAPFKLEGRLNGPSTALESVVWAPRAWESMAVQGQAFFDEDFGVRARERLRKGLTLTTDYSGIGCPEEALDHVVTAGQALAAEADEAEIPDSGFKSMRAGDQARQCRDILLHHSGRFKPQCVHRDILERCARKHDDRMDAILQYGQREAETEISRSDRKKSEVFATMGYKALKHMARFMLWTPPPSSLATRPLEAFCEVHNGMCPVLRPPAPRSEALRLHAAGMNCYDWSTMGGKKLWLGDSTKPFMQWLRERILAEEDVIVGECVLGFDHESFFDFLRDAYDLSLLKLSPTLIGEPAERQRKYMILLKRDRLKWLPCIEDYGVEDAFYRIFARRCCMLGQEKFRAPQQELDVYLESAVAKRHLPPHSRSGKDWSFFQVGSESVRASIKEHEAHLQHNYGNSVPAEQWIANLSQRPTHMPATRFFVPALLRGSNLWLMGKRRWQLPGELLEVQGFNIYGSPDTPQYECKIADHFKSMPKSQLTSVAGNAMHLGIIGSVWLFILGCTQPVK